MAAITSYGTLKTAVADYLMRSDLTSFVPNFVQNAELKLYRKLRLRYMETALSATISAGTIAVPSDYLELKHAHVVHSSYRFPLRRATYESLLEMYPNRGSDGMPEVIARSASSFYFGPSPDSSYTIEGIYYARPTLLYSGADNGTNWLITYGADALLYASLMEAEPFIKNDARLALWRDMLGMSLQSLIDESRDEDLSGGALGEVVA